MLNLLPWQTSCSLDMAPNCRRSLPCPREKQFMKSVCIFFPKSSNADHIMGPHGSQKRVQRKTSSTRSVFVFPQRNPSESRMRKRDEFYQMRMLFCAFLFIVLSCAAQASPAISKISSSFSYEANNSDGVAWNVTARDAGRVTVKVNTTASGDYGQAANNSTSSAAFLNRAIWGSSKLTIRGSRTGKGEKS